YREDGGKSYKRYRLTFIDTPHVGEDDKGMSARTTRVCPPDRQPLVGEDDSKNPQQGTPKKEPKELARAKFDPLEVDLPEGVTHEVWAEFVAHRAEKNRKLTPSATKRTLEDLVSKSK